MNKLIDNLALRVAAAIVFAASPAIVAAQPAQPHPARPNIKINIAPPAFPINRVSPRVPYTMPAARFFDTYEKSIKVDSAVNLTLGCVLDGTIRVNGWKRNEVRVLVSNGSKFAFQILEENPKTKEPVWIKLVAVQSKIPSRSGTDCLPGGEIEIDAPLNATIAIKGGEISTSIDSVKKVKIESVGGDVSLRNIANGVIVKANRGDVTVEASNGAMELNTTTGNILVFEAGPSEIGDVFKAYTNSGAVALQRLQYRQVNVDSVTGSVAYNGEILNGGSYNMRTSKGSLMLTIPGAASFKLWATYGVGNFSSGIPVDIETENNAPGRIQTIQGKAGKGDATLKLSTNNGSISIKRQ